MEIYKGKSIFKGIAIGTISFYTKERPTASRELVEEESDEIKRFEKAKQEALEEIKELYKKVLNEMGEVNAGIFEGHAMMLVDEEYHDFVVKKIELDKMNAEYAVVNAMDYFIQMFSNLEDEYFKARIADIKDVSERILHILTGHKDTKFLTKPSIIVAENLLPSDTVQFERNKILSFVTKTGASNSHTAILARMMNIPGIIQVDVMSEWDGKMGIVDGESGTIIIDPDQETLKQYRVKRKAELDKQNLYKTFKGKENITLSGKKINLFANINHISDLPAVLDHDAGGIGLFRSEFIYLEKADFPTEEEQFQIYKKVAQTMDEKKVIIRTLDVGADKQADYLGLEQEENPAMGCRAIRFCLMRKEMFKTQLRAILRASAFGNIAILYPMIISVQEVREIKELLEEVKKELTKEKIAYRNIEQGVMIETPAAAIISDLLAKEVEFFSIGTNDLTQYTLAIDRQNEKLEQFFDSCHEAVFRLIEMVIKNAHKEGIKVGICGELGADITLTERFLKMGIDEISVSPSLLLPLRKKIRESR